MDKGKIGIVGSGLIGRSWAMLFASVGYHVSLYDVEASRVDAALKDVKDQLKILEGNGMLRGTLSAEKQFRMMSKTTSLEECMKDAKHVQECVFEDLDLKKKVFQQMDKCASDTITLCSSTSCFPPSSFTENLVHRKQVVVGHPVNPPYYVPLVEIIPAPWTDPCYVTKTRNLMEEIGQKPVTLNKEIPGFALNRIQYAILNECWRLVQDDVMTVEDVDKVMSEGLGARYAFLGPLETAHLNAEGMVEYCEKYGAGIHKVSMDFGPVPKMEGKEVLKVHEQLCKKVPNLQERRKWRDLRLAALSKLKRDLDNKC